MKKLSLVLTLVLFAVSITLAQRTITGTITDENEEGLIGASILVTGTATGTITDFDGNYSLTVPEDATSLTFSYTGFSTQDIALGASNVVDVVMTEGVALGEVVVTAIGLEANRSKLGYSVQNVSTDEITQSNENNLVSALNAKVAGVQVTTSSGSPGSSANIRIRGATSINRSNSPLFVVDGVPIDNSEFNADQTGGVDQSNRAIDINPNDIASMSVLKGPAATALYGLRAANGAIVIQTKRGAEGKAKVQASVTYTASEYNKLPERQSAYVQGRPVDGVATHRGPETFEGFSWGPSVNDVEYDGDKDYFYNTNGRIVPKGTGNGQAINTYDPYSFFVTGQNVDANVSVSGGTDKLNYYFSSGFLNSEGIVPNADFQRATIKATTVAKLTDKLTASLSANYINSGGSRIQRGSNLRGVMLGLMRTSPSFDNGNGLEGQEAADDPTTYVAPDGSQRSYRAGVYDNPYWTANKNPFQDNVNRLLGFASLKYQLTDWAAITYKLGLDTYTDQRNFAQDINPGWHDGLVSIRNIQKRDLNSDLLLTLNKEINDDLSFSAVVGHNFFGTNTVDDKVDGTSLAITEFYNITNVSTVVTDQDISRKKIAAVFSTVDLNYKNYLFLNLTGRNDWSSTLPAEDNAFQSYSASLGFTFTDAIASLNNNNILPYGKVRLSYGKVGNDAPIYRTTTYFEQALAGGDGFITGVAFPSFGTNGFERSGLLGNPTLRPETTTTFEVGAELKFLRGRVGLDFTYYNSESSDIIVDVQISGATGFTNQTLNSGVISNKGIEIVGNVTPVRKSKFTWDIGVNFTQYENDVVALSEGVEQIFLAGFVGTSSRVVVGQPYGAIFGTGFQRDDNDNVLIDANGYPLQDPSQKVYGDPNPDYTMGIRNTFTILGGLRVSALLDIRQGGDMWCGTCGVIDYFGTSAQSGDTRGTSVVFDGVLADGSPNNISVPYADPAQGLGSYYFIRYGFGGIAEMSIYDTSWLRLRDLTVSYDVPKNISDKMGIGSLSVALSGRNLWLNTDYPGIDPETNLTGATNGGGLDYFNMPNTKSYSLTLRGTF